MLLSSREMRVVVLIRPRQHVAVWPEFDLKPVVPTVREAGAL
jgi:hypothetical protein